MLKCLKILTLCITVAVFALLSSIPVPAAGSATISLSPPTGVRGASVAVQGSGFGNRKKVDVSLDGNLMGKALTNASGSFSMKFKVPKSMAPAAYPVKAVEEANHLSALASLVVSSASISLSPTSGTDNSEVTITGTLFTAGETIDIYFDAVEVAFAIAISSGDFTQTFYVPSNAPVGPHTVTAIGQVSKLTLQAPFQVVSPPPPAISLSSTVGPPTTQVGVSGSGFGDNEKVDIYFDTTDVVLASTGPNGSFTESSTTPELQVPVFATPGLHWITAVGRTSGLSAQTSFTVSTDWTQFRNGPRHSGYNAFENVLDASNVSGLGLAFTAATGGHVISSPAVVGGVVYMGSLDNNLYAVNAGTGTTLWNFTTGGQIYSSPAVADAVVYAGSLDNNLYAVNAVTGAKLWNFTTGGQIYSSPAVADGVVYVGSLDNNLYAINAVTGAKLWNFATGGKIYSSPAVADGVVYVGSLDNNLYAVNAVTGAKLWNVATGGQIYSSPAVANGVVYVGSGDFSFYAFNAVTGAKLWNFNTGGIIWSSPAVADGVVYIGSNYHTLCALNAQTGALLWSAATDGQIYSSPAVANGVVYVGSNDQNLYALNAETGALLWSAVTGGQIYSSPAVANGVVYVGSNDNNLYAYDLAAAMSGFSPLTAGVARPAAGATPTRRPDLTELTPDYSLKLQ